MSLEVSNSDHQGHLKARERYASRPSNARHFAYAQYLLWMAAEHAHVGKMVVGKLSKGADIFVLPEDGLA